MKVGRGRILRSGEAMSSLTLACAKTLPETMAAERIAHGRIVRRERVQAVHQASEILSEARDQAAAWEREAREQAEEIQRDARREGLEQGSAKLAAAWLGLKQREAAADEASLDRSIAIARLLAERLIGESLRLDPELVAGLAREAMHHLWRSRRVIIHAHPEDMEALKSHVATFGMPPERISMVPDATRQRGCLRFESDFGEMDGEIGPQLDRLVQAIRQELGNELISP